MVFRILCIHNKHTLIIIYKGKSNNSRENDKMDTWNWFQENKAHQEDTKTLLKMEIIASEIRSLYTGNPIYKKLYQPRWSQKQLYRERIKDKSIIYSVR